MHQRMKWNLIAWLLSLPVLANTPAEEPIPYDSSPSLGGSICFIAELAPVAEKKETKSEVPPEQIPTLEKQAEFFARLADSASCVCVGCSTMSDPRWKEALLQAAQQPRLKLHDSAVESEAENLVYPAEGKLPSVEDAIRALQRASAGGKRLILHVEVGTDGTVRPEVPDLLKRLGDWRRLHVAAFEHCFPVPSVSLPDGWYATIVGEDTYIFPPALKPKKDVILRIPAHEIDTVVATVLGQPNLIVATERVEESGKDEPKAFMQMVFPMASWDSAPEGLPVFKLINAQ